MTDLLFRDDPYQTGADCRIIAHTPEGGLIVDRSIFYPTGGGQPGDSGMLDWAGGRLPIATAIKVDGGIALLPAEPLAMPPVGAAARQVLDWTRRHRHMRVHTALHLLSVVIPLPVTEDWITDAELEANPGLVKTMSVRPPVGQGRVRLIRIGQGAGQIDLQPCGGTHVARTAEIGRIAIGKIEKKGRQNRRVTISLVG